VDDLFQTVITFYLWRFSTLETPNVWSLIEEVSASNSAYAVVFAALFKLSWTIAIKADRNNTEWKTHKYWNKRIRLISSGSDKLRLFPKPSRCQLFSSISIGKFRSYYESTGPKELGVPFDIELEYNFKG
jgi:hypothetical protein